MFDTEKLISLVQSNPCLWDKSSKDYADRTLKNTCWQNIAESMHANWRELSNFQRDEKSNYYLKIYNSIKIYLDLFYTYM